MMRRAGGSDRCLASRRSVGMSIVLRGALSEGSSGRPQASIIAGSEQRQIR